MVHEDFSIESLADYLHLAPAQVTKLVERGELPGRRVAGTWRFSAGEIHHWLEQRIGVANEAELQKMEAALHRSDRAAHTGEPSLANLLLPEGVAIPLAARTRSGAIAAMAELAAGTGLLWDSSRMAEAVRAREDLHPTALDNGVALLHPRRPMPEILGDNLLALGITGQGIGFGGSRGVLTDIFFLIGAIDDRSHLRILARLSRLVSQTELLDRLRAAHDAAEAIAVIDEAEQGLPG